MKKACEDAQFQEAMVSYGHLDYHDSRANYFGCKNRIHKSMAQLKWDPCKTQQNAEKGQEKNNNHINVNKHYEARSIIKNRAMVKFSMYYCTESDMKNCNSCKMVLFTAPKKPKERVCRKNMVRAEASKTA